MAAAPAMAHDSHHQPPGHAKGGPGPAQHVAHHHAKKVILKPHQAWKVGHSMPASYRAKAYRVQDYRTHHLKRPAKNQHWYQVNGDYVLINAVSNSIVQIITGR